MAEDRIERLADARSDENGAMGDERWGEVEESLRRQLGRGSLTLAQAERLFAGAPDERLSEEQIQGLVTATVQRAREITQSAEHWHVWIGATSRTIHGEMTLHVTGFVGAKAAVAAMKRTIHTPNWSIVSVSSLDRGLEPLPAPVEPAADCIDCSDEHSWDISTANSGVADDCWQFSTDVTLDSDGNLHDASSWTTLDEERA